MSGSAAKTRPKAQQEERELRFLRLRRLFAAILIGLSLTGGVLLHRAGGRKSSVNLAAGSTAASERRILADTPELPDPASRRPATAARAAESIAVEGGWAEELRILKELAALAPDAALARVERMPDKHERKAAAAEVCLVVATNDPAKALTAAWRLELGRFANEESENVALERLANRWAQTDIISTLEWASTLPDDDELRRDRVVKGIVSAVADNTPNVAAKLVATDFSSDSSVQIEAAIEVLRRWAQQDYIAAMSWAALFPNGALRERALDELANIEVHDPTSLSRAH